MASSSLREIHIHRDGPLGIAAVIHGKANRLSVVDEVRTFRASRLRSVLDAFDLTSVLLRINSLPPTVKRLIETFLVFYAVADRRPDGKLRTVTSDVAIELDAIPWLESLFAEHGHALPELRMRCLRSRRITRWPSGAVAVAAFSGGKDSLFVTLQQGAVPIHVVAAQRSTATRELQAVQKLSTKMPIQPTLLLMRNSFYHGPGQNAFCVRDALLVSLMLVAAYRLGAKDIYLGSYPSARCSLSARSFAMLEALLRSKGIPVTLHRLENQTKETVIRRALAHYPELLPLTTPCIMPEIRFCQFRKWFVEKFPPFPLWDGCCGVCGECVNVNGWRLVYDRSLTNIPNDVRQAVRSYCIRRARVPGIADIVSRNLAEQLGKLR